MLQPRPASTLMLLPILFATLLLSLVAPTSRAADAIPSIPRVVPPEGLEIPADVRTRLETRLAATKKRLENIKEFPDAASAATLLRPDVKIFTKPDVEIFTKAVEL